MIDFCFCIHLDEWQVHALGLSLTVLGGALVRYWIWFPRRPPSQGQ